jgi:hypothetical protein
MSSSGTTLASGTRASIRYTRERTRNEVPALLGTPATNLEATATSPAGAGYSLFTRASGSFLTDGVIKGQKVVTSGFATSANNGTWIVHSVTATVLTVRDPNDVIANEGPVTAASISVALIDLRATGRNINLEKNALESQEVDPDGQETDVRHGFNRVVGSPGFQLSRADLDDAIEFTMGREWDDGITVTSSPNLGVNSAGAFTRAAGSFITDGFRPGDIIRTTGFSNTSNNADWRLTAVTATTATAVSTLDGSTAPVGESSGSSKTFVLPGKRIDIGTDLCTLFIERAFADVSRFQGFKGCAFDEWQLNIEPEAMINGTFAILGMSALAMASTSAATLASIGSSGNSPYAAFDGEIYEGGSRIAVATSLNFTLARNRSLNPVIGSRFSPDVFEGTARCQGNLAAYFQDEVLFNKFVNETESSVWTRLDDPNSATDFMNLVWPRVKYNGAPMDPPQEGPITLEMPWRALKATGLAVPGGTTRNSLMTVQVSNTKDI